MADWETGVFVIFRHFSRKCFNNRKLCLISIVYALQSLKFFIKSSWLDLSRNVDSLETENKCHEKDCGEDTFVKFSGWISNFPRNSQFHWPIWATIFLFIYSPHFGPIKIFSSKRLCFLAPSEFRRILAFIP